MTDTFPIIVPEHVRKRLGVRDEMIRPKKTRSKYDPVVVVCYNTLEKWESREDALRFYFQGSMECDGCEAERYQNVCIDIEQGNLIATDMGLSVSMTDYTKLNVPDIYVVDGTDKLMDIRTHKTKTLEEIESYFWDAFLQGFDDWCGQSIDTAWLNYLREYQTCLREFINGTE